MASTDNNPPSTSSTAAETPNHLPTAKLTALARLKSFTGSFVPHRSDKSNSARFPPPSWELDDSKDEGAGAGSIASNYTHSTHNDTLHPQDAAASSTRNPDAQTEPPEPLTFANRLRTLIDSLPLPGVITPTPASSATPATKVDDGKQGSPVPPGMDEGLIRMLSDEDVMNGSPGTKANGNEPRQSVWSILAGLGNDVKERVIPAKVEEKEEGVMMYAPLQPTNDSQLELAESESVLEYVDDPQEKDKKQPESSTTAPPTVERHVWVPSTTQLSLLTTWWGYRLYLPPPVMQTLDGSSLKATARAAMITSALKWLLNKIPVMLVPPQLRGAVTLLKRLSPVVGYVGVFIAWSWGRVRACDKGNGVVLTATWLLPVALVPMAWDAGDIYGPPVLPKQDSSSKQGDSAGGDKDKNDGKKKSRFGWLS